MRSIIIDARLLVLHGRNSTTGGVFVFCCDLGGGSVAVSMSTIACVDHGKSTLADSLINKADIIPVKVTGDARFTDTRADEQERGVTTKSIGVSLYFEHDEDDGKSSAPHIVYLTVFSSCVDSSSVVIVTLRIINGVMVVVDCIEGCAVQTVAVLCQSLADRVKPYLFVNKIDRCIPELNVDLEDMHRRCCKVIGMNATITALHDVMGDNFSNAKRKMWTKVKQLEGCSEALPKIFCQCIMTLINQMMFLSMANQTEKYDQRM